jgi:hypothetical protein
MSQVRWLARKDVVMLPEEIPRRHIGVWAVVVILTTILGSSLPALWSYFTTKDPPATVVPTDNPTTTQALQETAMALAVQGTVEARDTATAQAVVVTATTATREVTTTTQPIQEAVPTQDTTAQTETMVAQQATDEAQRSQQTETAQEATTVAKWAQETETALRKRETEVAQQATTAAQTTVAQQATNEALEQERLAAQREQETAVAREATEAAAPKVGQCPPTAEEAANLFGGNTIYWRPLEGNEEYAWKYGPALASPIANFNIPEGMKGDWWDGNNAHSKQGPAQGGEAFEATIWCVP